MNGGYVHEDVLLRPLEQAFRHRGISVFRQVPSRPGRGARYVDLLADLGHARLAIEAEMTPRRVASDLQKAAELEAWLWIVVPNRSVREAVQRSLRKQHVPQREPWICVLTLPQALQRITDCCSICVSVVAQKNKKTKNHIASRNRHTPPSPPHS